MAAFEVWYIYDTWRPFGVLELRWFAPQQSGLQNLCYGMLDLGDSDD